jgi:Cdc6-like AAA superfamily ATPase
MRPLEWDVYRLLVNHPLICSPSLFLYGGVATGKSCVAHEIVKGHRHAYVDCLTVLSLRHMFEQILNDLSGHVPGEVV